MSRASDSSQTPSRQSPRASDPTTKTTPDSSSTCCLPLADPDGLPEIIHFWKARIEEPEPDTMFRVGVIYGPSGCGKSSLVKAGLLPRLSDPVLRVYVEATPDQTESELLKHIRWKCPDLPPDLGLVESLAALHDGEGITSGQEAPSRHRPIRAVARGQSRAGGHRLGKSPRSLRRGTGPGHPHGQGRLLIGSDPIHGGDRNRIPFQAQRYPSRTIHPTSCGEGACGVRASRQDSPRSPHNRTAGVYHTSRQSPGSSGWHDYPSPTGVVLRDI